MYVALDMQTANINYFNRAIRKIKIALNKPEEKMSCFLGVAFIYQKIELALFSVFR